jgi:hypothetical protein
MRASAFCWRAACQRCGGNPPAPAFPRRGKRGSSDFLAAAGSSSLAPIAGTPTGTVRTRSTTTLPSILITNLYVNALDPLSRSLAGRASSTPLPCFYPHSQMGRAGARWKLGFDLKPRSITTVTDLSCWVLPSCERSPKDQSYQTQSPEQGGGCRLGLRKLLEACWPSRHQLMLAICRSTLR